MSPYAFLNQNSYGIAAVILAAWAAWYAVRARTPRSVALLLVVAVALVVPPLWLRSSQSSLGELDHALAAGQPAMLELYSDL
jgi:hypothetical protein